MSKAIKIGVVSGGEDNIKTPITYALNFVYHDTISGVKTSWICKKTTLAEE